MTFKTPYNADMFPHHRLGVKNTMPSMTVPDQSMTIREIMDRYARGLPLGSERVPLYNGEDDDMPDITHLDLAEQQEIIENAGLELHSMKEKLIRENNERRKLSAKAAAQQPPNTSGPYEPSPVPEPGDWDEAPAKTTAGAQRKRRVVAGGKQQLPGSGGDEA